MSGSNYDDVLSQLQGAGFEVHHLEVGRMVRCKVQGLSQKGWYSLYEIYIENELVIGGSYGWFIGSELTKHKINLGGRNKKLTKEQRDAIQAKFRADQKRAEAARKAKAEKAAITAERAWKNKLSEDGHCQYLDKKRVQAHGVRFSPNGNMAIPMRDTSGRIHGLQVIYGDPDVIAKKKRDKDFFPTGLVKKGHFHMIGSPTWLIIVAEGYATAASIHEASRFPVAVAWDAGNLQPVAQALKKRYRNARILIAADDDWLGKCRACGKYTPVADEACQHCGQPHGKHNTGVTAASAAALAVGGAYVLPKFTDRGTHKWTDFNDLAVHETPSMVQDQIEACLDELQWRPKTAALATTTGGRGEALKPLLTVDEACERFALIYGSKGSIFDFQERALIPKSDVLDILPDHGWREWKLRNDRKVVRFDEVGFDPSGRDPKIKCNLWGGWPTQPKSGCCESLLDLLAYLCNNEETGGHELFQWVIKWCAYPLQHPGAKMKTALVLHGPQGAGKNMFFEAYGAIYDHYAMVVDQDAVEDKFNDWCSKKLFLIADEVVARQELYHTKNKIKGLITGDTIRINPKHVTGYTEANHVNIVFMSNEVQPLVLEQDDRRFAVIWTPEKLDQDFYEDVKEEIDSGGIAALHDYLLNVDLGDFKPWTLPPMTQAKADLITLGLDSTERFIRAWLAGDLEPIPVLPCLSEELYKLYRAWCSDAGIRNPAPRHILLARVGKHREVVKEQARYLLKGKPKMATFVFPVIKRNPPDGQNQAPWLTDCLREFREGVEEWKTSQENA